MCKRTSSYWIELLHVPWELVIRLEEKTGVNPAQAYSTRVKYNIMEVKDEDKLHKIACASCHSKPDQYQMQLHVIHEYKELAVTE